MFGIILLPLLRIAYKNYLILHSFPSPAGHRPVSPLCLPGLLGFPVIRIAVRFMLEGLGQTLSLHLNTARSALTGCGDKGSPPDLTFSNPLAFAKGIAFNIKRISFLLW